MYVDSFDGLREAVFAQYPFSLSNEEKDALSKINASCAPTIVADNRSKLEHLGNRCAVFKYLKDSCEEHLNSDKDCTFDPLLQEYSLIRNSYSNIWELMGFVSLLEMDSISMLVSILSAQNDIERKMLGKHAYAIAYETRQKGLYQKISKELKKFPEAILPKTEYDELWRTIKKDLKDMSSADKEKTIRNSIDAHKSSSFEIQYETFYSCNWAQSVLDLIVLIQISDRLLNVIESVFSRCEHELDIVTEKLKNRVSQYDAILEVLKKE